MPNSRFAAWSMTMSAKKAAASAASRCLGQRTICRKLVDEMDIEQVVIAIDQAQGKEIRRMIDLCTAIPVRAQIVPSLNEIATRPRFGQPNTRCPDRGPARPRSRGARQRKSPRISDRQDRDGHRCRRLDRIGACPADHNYQPKTLLLVERAEFFLFKITRELSGDSAERCLRSADR